MIKRNIVMRAGAVMALAVGLGTAAAADFPGQGFRTPGIAMDALYDLIGQADPARVDAMFGPGGYEMFSSGDPAADKADFGRVKEMIGQQVLFDDVDDDTMVALLGTKQWPWPVPLVERNGLWYFDAAAGREELLNRRIGRNELWTLTALREAVEAQREYRATGHDGLAPAYAQRFRSSPGRRDGLWWPVEPDEPESPLGDLLAGSEPATSGEPQPFHGYYYRMLKAQGPDAPGGERSFVDAQGLMTGGFAVLAWPAKHDNSGVMTFLVSDRGIIYQRDLGPDTATAARAITSFNPDSNWTPTGDVLADGVD